MAAKADILTYKTDYSLFNNNAGLSDPKVTSPGLTLPAGKSLTVGDLQSVTELKAAQKTLKVWKEVAYERLGIMRRRVSETPSEVTKKEYEEDRIRVVQYINILELYEPHLSNMIAKSDESSVKVLRHVKDQDRNIQAMSSFTIYNRQVFLNLVLTAPWNLRMHAPNLDEHKTLVTKGSGTALIDSGYRMAQQLGKEELRLKPMDGSYTFYKERLLMEESTNGEFFYPVSSEIPAALQSQT